MESRSDFPYDRKRVETPKPKRKYVRKARATVTLCLLKDVKLNIVGKVTGKKYTFNGAGSTLPVDKEDAKTMITKTGNKKCCSGDIRPSLYFQIIN